MYVSVCACVRARTVLSSTDPRPLRARLSVSTGARMDTGAPRLRRWRRRHYRKVHYRRLPSRGSLSLRARDALSADARYASPYSSIISAESITDVAINAG